MLGLQLLVDMVTGQLGDQGEQSGAATISRVLLAGNLLSQNSQDKDASTKVRETRPNLHLILFVWVMVLLLSEEGVRYQYIKNIIKYYFTLYPVFRPNTWPRSLRLAVWRPFVCWMSCCFSWWWVHVCSLYVYVPVCLCPLCLNFAVNPSLREH